jgi:hypothetical protein
VKNQLLAIMMVVAGALVAGRIVPGGRSRQAQRRGSRYDGSGSGDSAGDGCLIYLLV